VKIAIAGYGLEGKASLKYWTALGDDVTIVDENDSRDDLPSNVKSILGPNAFSKLSDFDLVIRTASLAPEKIKTNGKVWSATNEFFAKCPAPIIGVTGTKGKGTTCSLITSILRSAGSTVHLVGNIGLPALEILEEIKPEDIVVYELSSFQLWDIEKSPQTAVILKIEPDHLDVHSDFDEYVAAKSGISKYQRPIDLTYYHPTNQISAKIAMKSSGQKYRYDKGIICSTDHLRLPGAHNLENASAAIAVSKLYVDDSDKIALGLSKFEGLEHRLKFVAEKSGVRYYDDSIATTAGSAVAAIDSFNQPKVIILGGWDKVTDLNSVVELCRETGTKIVAVGQTGKQINDYAKQIDTPSIYIDGTMKEVVAAAAMQAVSGGVVLLSPACSSFDQYKSYADRGEQFIAAVHQLDDESH
jgi:UDP-N-acetylmuramoylalanine--D-glutamate ligase